MKKLMIHELKELVLKMNEGRVLERSDKTVIENLVDKTAKLVDEFEQKLDSYTKFEEALELEDWQKIGEHEKEVAFSKGERLFRNYKRLDTIETLIERWYTEKVEDLFDLYVN